MKEQLISFWKDQGLDSRLVDAFDAVPRELFVSPEFSAYAYEDRPLPTLRGQSLSQPTTVMVMSKALEVEPGQKILEVGAGVGYQACLLGHLVGLKGKVITTEVIPELVEGTKKNVLKLGLANVQVIEQDGSRGFEEEAPFDRIIITAACPKIPQPLIEQTKEGGIIVAPVGDLQGQTMVKAVKRGDKLDFSLLGDFAFVPLQGKYGFEKD